MTPADPQADADRRMARYYAERAANCERVCFKPERQRDLRRMESALPAWFAGRHVLEIACGTGWWTPHGASDCASWLATDLNELGPRAHDARRVAYKHYGLLAYDLD